MKLWRVLVLVLGLVLACGGRPDLREIAVRLIAEDPADFFDRVGLVERVALETWRFEGPRDLRPWRAPQFDRRFAIERRTLVLGSSKRHARLGRNVDWDAASIDAIELRTRDFQGGQLRLHWARRGERLAAESSLGARAETGGRFLFDLAGHPTWTGGIRRLWIQVSSPPGEERRLRSVVALAYRPIPERVAQAVQQAWKIDLDHEVRSGLLALPRMPIDRRVSVPAGGVLRFGFGVDAASDIPFEFSISVERGDEETVELFRAVLDPAKERQVGRWHDREVDLSPFAGEQVVLRLLTRAVGKDYDLIDGLAFWSNPVVMREATRPIRPNVVLISIDTLRADHLSLYGYPRKTSPFLDAWSEENAVVFEKVVAASPWTIPSHLSIFSGLDALRHGVNDADRIPGSHRLMAEILRAEGYDTLAITGGGFVHPERGFVQGFDRYRYWPVAKSSGELENGIAHALEWVEEARDRPFFLFFHTFEVHYPYLPRQPFFDQLSGGAEVPGSELRLGVRERVPEAGFLLTKKLQWIDRSAPEGRRELSGDDFQTVVDLYDSAIAYTDAQLRRLLERLAELELDRRSIIVITSDHGEALGEKGLAGHAYLYDFNLLVPLIVALPDGRGRGERIVSQVRSIDLLPTIMELVGLSAPADIDGSSLLPVIEGQGGSHPQEAWSYSAFSNQGLSLRVGNRLKYMFNNTAWPQLHGREQLFDLRRDPMEDNDIAAGAPPIAELRAKARAAAGTLGGTLRVRFANSCAAPYRGSMRGIAVQINTVKSSALPPSGLVWRDGAAAFVVRPGETFEALIERFARGRFVNFRGAFDAGIRGCEGGFEERVELDAAEGAWQLAYAGGRWTVSDDSKMADPATGFSVSWRRAAGEKVAASYVESPELMDQLRALGYVE